MLSFDSGRNPRRCQLPTEKHIGPWGFKPGTLLESAGSKEMSITWSVEQSGHPAAVADVLFTALCTGGDGCHLENTQIIDYY